MAADPKTNKAELLALIDKILDGEKPRPGAVMLDDEKECRRVLTLCGIDSWDGISDTFSVHSDMSHLTGRYDENQLQNDSVTALQWAADVNHLMDETQAAFGTMPGSNPNFIPTADELKQYNDQEGTSLEATDGKVYYAIITGSKVNRKGQHLLKKATSFAADNVAGVPVMDNHDHEDSKNIFGKAFYGQKFRSSDGSERVAAKFWVPNAPEYEQYHTGFKHSINNQISIGFKVRRKDMICDSCKAPMFQMPKDDSRWMEWCGHMPNMEQKDGTYCTMSIADMCDMYEFSRVPIPAYKGAAVRVWGKGGPAQNPAGGGMQNSAFQNGVDVPMDRTKMLDSLSTTIIPLDTNVGVQNVANENPNGQQADAGATPPVVPPATPPVIPPTPPVTVEVSLNDAVEGIVKGLTELNKKCLDSIDKGTDGQKEIKDALGRLVELATAAASSQQAHVAGIQTWKEEVTARQTQLQKEVEANKQLLNNQVSALTYFAQCAGFAATQSNQDAARQAANAKPMGQTALNAEKELVGGDNFYESTLAPMFKPRNGR